VKLASRVGTSWVADTAQDTVGPARGDVRIPATRESSQRELVAQSEAEDEPPEIPLWQRGPSVIAGNVLGRLVEAFVEELVQTGERTKLADLVRKMRRDNVRLDRVAESSASAPPAPPYIRSLYRIRA